MNGGHLVWPDPILYPEIMRAARSQIYYTSAIAITNVMSATSRSTFHVPDPSPWCRTWVWPPWDDYGNGYSLQCLLQLYTDIPVGVE